MCYNKRMEKKQKCIEQNSFCWKKDYKLFWILIIILVILAGGVGFLLGAWTNYDARFKEYAAERCRMSHGTYTRSDGHNIIYCTGQKELIILVDVHGIWQESNIPLP